MHITHRPPRYALFALFLAAISLFTSAALPSTTLVILSKTDHVMEIRDPVSFAVLARPPLVPTPMNRPAWWWW